MGPSLANYIHGIHYTGNTAVSCGWVSQGFELSTGVLTELSPEDREGGSQPRVVLCGSFRRDPEGLGAIFRELSQVAVVLSPVSTEFSGEWDGFVYTTRESEMSPWDIEQRHLSAILDADFVWLFAPSGYVGESARTELVYARLAGIPVYTSDRNLDVGIQQWARMVASPAAAVDGLKPLEAPASGLGRMQRYYGRFARERGWDSETLQDTMLLLTEEIGELARAVRRVVHLARDAHGSTVDNPAQEIADVLFYLLHLSNAMNIDLDEAVAEKDRINRERAGFRRAS